MICEPVSSQKRDILGVKFDLIDHHRTLEIIHRWRESGKQGYVTLTNPHSVLLCRRDKNMMRATTQADLTLPDGAGISLAARLLRYEHCGRVTGPMLMLQLCDWGRRYGYRHYFYGGAKGVADRLAQHLLQQFPGLGLAGTYCPPFRTLTPQEDAEIVEQINAARPDVLWVGLGAPKQEKWMLQHKDRVKAPAMIGVGAAFDFHSGNAKWAPAWMRKLGLEWAYRLAQEPKRMWRRNLDSPVFLTRLIGQRLSRMTT